ncbi:FAD-dependent monooxygenase [Pseudoxanthomonas sp. NC8]|nr:FAD-dependent monooxygenase [Pseudoxanthomonas sp. NC8]
MARRISLCPLMGTELFQLQAPVPPDGEVALSVEGLHNMVRERTARDDIVVHAVLWSSLYQMNARLADRFRDRRVFLAGDAAHTHPPTGGQGLNTSAQDGYNLGWKLASVLRGAPARLLDTYEEERRPIAASVLGLTTRLLDNAKARRPSPRPGRAAARPGISGIMAVGTGGPQPADRSGQARAGCAAAGRRRTGTTAFRVASRNPLDAAGIRIGSNGGPLAPGPSGTCDRSVG